jgi:hypothetical protein
MKKVFFISVLALVCMVCTTSCSKDDDGGGAALTGIKVTPPSFKGAVGAVQKITATAEPANAALGTLSWTSSASSVATVDQAGVVTIAGVGTAEVTVTSGTISQKVSIEGTIGGLTVTDSEGNSAGTHVYVDEDITVPLTATITPANSGKIPVWSSSAATATVVAAADGLTAVVTITGKGIATITVTVDETTATYTISTTSLLESAAGYWTFDDPENLGKGVRGGDLRFEADWVQVVDGPSATKKAVYVRENPNLVDPNYSNCPDVKDTCGFYWDHNMPGTGAVTYNGWSESGPLGNIVGQYTFLMDVRIPVEPNNYHYPTFLTPNDYIFHYGLDLRPDNGNLVICSNWGTRGSVVTGMVAGQEPWVRVVIKCDLSTTIAEGLNAPDWGYGDVWVYANGANVYTKEEGGGDTSLGFTSIIEGQPVKFLGGMPEGENFNYSVSTIAVWNRLLTDDEIASLGGVDK